MIKRIIQPLKFAGLMGLVLAGTGCATTGKVAKGALATGVIAVSVAGGGAVGDIIEAMYMMITDPKKAFNIQDSENPEYPISTQNKTENSTDTLYIKELPDGTPINY